ncbi:MAG: ABC transporter permease [Bacteroidota bacterium]
MLRNYLKIAWRSIWKDKVNSSIKIVGLVGAIISMLFAVIYWNDEHSFDTFHQNIPHLYRVTTTLVEQNGTDPITVGQTGQVQGPAFQAAIPEIRNFVRLWGGDIRNDVSGNGKNLNLNILFADRPFFEVFSFPLIHGDPATALQEINSVVITESTARRFFNTVDVVGEVLSSSADPSFQKLKKPLVISAVVKDPPRNASMQFDLVLPFAFAQLSFTDTNWLNTYLGTFVLLNPLADVDTISRKMDAVFAVHAQEQLGKSTAQYGFDPEIHYGLQDVREMHLNPLFRPGEFNGEGGVVNSSSPLYSLVFMGIALLILVIASINFVNISLASSFKRAGEIGVRKVVGGKQGQIVFQFLAESGLLCIIAFGISVLLLSLLMPLFNEFTGRHYVFLELWNIRLLVYLVTVFAGIVALTGVYPALILAKLRPVEVLNHRVKIRSNRVLSQGLIVFQFSLGTVLLVGALVFYKQLDYIRTKELGYNPDQIIEISITGNRDYEAIGNTFKRELGKEPSIGSVSFLWRYAHSHGWVKTENNRMDARLWSADENYLNALEIPILLGRNFSTDFPSDISDAVVVNETFVRKSNLEDPIGKQLILDENEDYRQTKTIVGVMKDYHYGSLREAIAPLVLSMVQKPGKILVKLEKSRQQEALAAISKVHTQLMPDAVFDYHFLNELNAKQYEQEQRWQKIVTSATLLAFLVCALGLFGMAHLSANQRIKEVGIRKVLGATVSQIAMLLSVNFLRLVLVSFVIAMPVAWWAMDLWLQGYAYRTHVGWTLFALAAVITIVITVIAIGLKAVGAATANPVRSLRTE